MLFSDAVDVLLPGAVHLTALLLAASGWAWWRRSVARRWAVTLTAAAVWSWVFSAPAVGNLWVRHIEGPVPALAEPVVRDDGALVVVLASGELSNRGGPLAARLDAAGVARLTAGVDLWRRAGGRLAVVGGTSAEPAAGRGAVNSIASEMASQAQSWGVPASAIVVVDGSTRTHEDLMRASPLIRSNRGPVWLVTSALHMPRSLAIARHLGLDVRPHRCDYRQFPWLRHSAWLPNSGGPAIFAAALHEAVGLVYYRWRGWA